jgi:hypothetical protein
MKLSRRPAGTLALLCLLLPVFIHGAAPTATLTLLLPADSSYRYAHVRIGGSFQGRLYRGEPRTFTVLTGNPIRIAVYRARERTLRNVNPAPGAALSLAIPLPDPAAPPPARISLLLPGWERVSAAILLNGNPAGTLKPGEEREFSFPPGDCTVTATAGQRRFTWRGRIAPGTSLNLTIRLR